MYSLLKYMVCGLLLATAGNVNASLLSFTVNGTVNAAENYGGLSAGDSITADVTLDLFGYTAVGQETFSFTGSNTLDITAGTLLFDESMDSALNSSITFLDGELVDLNFGALFGVNGAPEEFDSFNLNVLANRSETTGKGRNAVTTNYTLAATWTPVTISAVPVPAAVWLFGSGLLGLLGVARRRR